jgi:hypothetical protein
MNESLANFRHNCYSLSRKFPVHSLCVFAGRLAVGVWIAIAAKGSEKLETKGRNPVEEVWIAKGAKGSEKHETKGRNRESEDAKG